MKNVYQVSEHCVAAIIFDYISFLLANKQIFRMK